jgi:hypothetical protein
MLSIAGTIEALFQVGTTAAWKVEGLPGSIHPPVGRLEVEFFGTEDLLKQLLVTGPGDHPRHVCFQEICEP